MRGSIHKFENYARCPQKYYFRHGLKLVPKHIDVPLRVGRAVHKFLETFAANQSKPFDTKMTVAQSAMIGDLKSTMPEVSVNSIEEKLVKQCTRLVSGYVRKYGEADEVQIFEPEVEDEVDLPGGHKLVFRVDAPVSFQGRLWIVDHKTTAQPIGRIIKFYEMNHQLIAYAYAVAKKTGQEVAGAIVNILKRESDREAMDFHREYIPISKRHMANTVMSLSNVFTDIESRSLSDRNQWPLYTHSCFSPAKCWYYRICHGGEAAEPGAIFRLDERKVEDRNEPTSGSDEG